MISGGELLIKTLKEKYNITTIFTLVGNHISPALVYCAKFNVRIVDVRHEQGAILMADAYSQVSRKCGVAMVVGGPGFTNSISGIIKAYLANTPILVITGAIVSQNKDMNALQDIDQKSIIERYCKWFARIDDTNRIPEYLEKAFQKTLHGKRGPVVLEIPINVMKNEVIERNWKITKERLGEGLAVWEVNKIRHLLASNLNVVMILGDEVYYSEAETIVYSVIQKYEIPTYTMGKARGCISDSDKYCMGNARLLDNIGIEKMLQSADIVIVVGQYIDYQMCDFSQYVKGKKVIIITEEDDGILFEDTEECLHIIGNIRTIFMSLEKEGDYDFKE